MARNFRCNRLKLRPGALDAVEAWAEDGRSGAEEVAATLRDEGIDLELVLLEHASDGDYLIFIMETDDYERAVEVFNRSKHAIDERHRAFLEANVVGSTQLRVLNCHEAYPSPTSERRAPDRMTRT